MGARVESEGPSVLPSPLSVTQAQLMLNCGLLAKPASYKDRHLHRDESQIKYDWH